MAEETAEEADQRVNATPRSQMKINLDSESQNASKLKIIAMMIGLGILTWIRSSMPTRFQLKNKGSAICFYSDKRQAKVKQNKQLESDTDDKKKRR